MKRLLVFLFSRIYSTSGYRLKTPYYPTPLFCLVFLILILLAPSARAIDFSDTPVDGAYTTKKVPVKNAPFDTAEPVRYLSRCKAVSLIPAHYAKQDKDLQNYYNKDWPAIRSKWIILGSDSYYVYNRTHFVEKNHLTTKARLLEELGKQSQFDSKFCPFLAATQVDTIDSKLFNRAFLSAQNNYGDSSYGHYEHESTIGLETWEKIREAVNEKQKLINLINKYFGQVNYRKTKGRMLLEKSYLHKQLGNFEKALDVINIFKKHYSLGDLTACDHKFCDRPRRIDLEEYVRTLKEK